MAAIKSKGTKPEQYICHELFKRGYRYRKNVNYIAGRPDLFLRKFNTAIFVHGCFWHRHNGCKYAYVPKTRTDYWIKKFNSNIERDKAVQYALREEGIKCLVIWECTIKKMKRDEQHRDSVLDEIEVFLNSNDLFAEY